MRTSCPRWKLRRTFTAAGPRGRTSVVVVPAVPVALDRRQERRFEVRDRAGRGLAVDELRLASLAGGAEAAFAALQTNRDDVAVVVAMLDGGVLGHVQRPHRWVASAGTPGCQSMAAWQRVVAPPRPRCHDGAVAPANRLARETSPYLLQHAHNPVDWFPWGEEAFTRARAENKPILLSLGYSACHWCHVMERESFENPDVARLMNELFINVKVDREERPDVDDVYMKAVQMLTARADRAAGGLGGARKCPPASACRLFLRRHRAPGGRASLEAVLLTCDRMAKGGVCDQIGGGVHRYAVDARWLVPHFEKMLYDNAQLPRLYLEANQVTGEPGLRRMVEETLDYVLRDMRHPEGGFYSATDADSEGEEGKYFVWTPAEVARLVDPNDVDLVCRYWDISEEGNFEGKSIPHVTLTVEQVARMFGRSPAEGAAALERTRTRLLAARAERVPPARDEKILASWNGLVIGTLAEAGRGLRTQRFVGAAWAAG